MSNLIQASVAIVFLNDMDNMAYNAIMPDGFKEEISRQYFQTPHLKKKTKTRRSTFHGGGSGDTGGGEGAGECVAEKEVKPKPPRRRQTALMLVDEIEEIRRGGEGGGNKVTGLARFFYFMSMLGATPILVGSSVGIVYGLHSSYC